MSRALICELDKDKAKKAPELAKKLTLLDAINFLCEAWNGVTEKTMVNCWRKSGLCSGPEENEEVEVIDPEILERLNLDSEAFNKWVAVDDSVPTGPSGTDEEIVEEVKNKFDEEENDSSDDEIEVELPKISNSEAFAALNCLKNFYLQKDDSSVTLLALDRIRRDLEKQMSMSKSQMTMETFIQQ